MVVSFLSFEQMDKQTIGLIPGVMHRMGRKSHARRLAEA
jgi:hypothetical protein